MSENSDTWDIPAWAAATPTTGSYPTVRPVTARQEFTYPRRRVIYPPPVQVYPRVQTTGRPQVTPGCIARVQGSFLLLAWLGVALALSWLFGG